MKTLALTLTMITLLTFNGLGQSKEIKTLLDKPETRKEVFNTIMNDHELMMDFMNQMKGNQHAKMMMNENSQMKPQDVKMDMKGDHQMMGHENMMNMMKNNPEMMQKMMSNMMEMCEKDSTMRDRMTDMMAQHPEMMQKCMQMMNEKGMSAKEGRMHMMESGKKSENQHDNKD